MAQNISGIFLETMQVFDTNTTDLWNTYAEINPPEVVETSTTPEPKYKAATVSAIAQIPVEAQFINTGGITTPDVAISNSYESTEVQAPQDALGAYGDLGDSGLDSPVAYDSETGALRDHVVAADEAITEAISSIAMLQTAIDIVFTPTIETYYTALWQSGFIDLLQDFAASDLAFVKSAVDTRQQGVISTALASVTSPLNKRGFFVPAAMLAALQSDIQVVGSHMTADTQREFDLAVARFLSDIKALGVSSEGVVAGFTKQINDFEVEFDKVRYAGAIAQSQGSVRLLQGGLSSISDTLRGLLEIGGVSEQYLGVEQQKVSATLDLSQSWGTWTKATLAASELTQATNSIHFKEFQNELRLADVTDELNRLRADASIDKVEVTADKDISAKRVELTINEVEIAKQRYKLLKSAAAMSEAKSKLAAYTQQFTADYEKVMSTVSTMTAEAAIAKQSGKLLGAIVMDSAITVTK